MADAGLDVEILHREALQAQVAGARANLHVRSIGDVIGKAQLPVVARGSEMQVHLTFLRDGKIAVAAGNLIFHARLTVGFVVIEIGVQQLVGAGTAGDVERTGGNVNIGGDGLRALQTDVLGIVQNRA